MGQSLIKNYLHLVFSTKHRVPFIDDAIEEELHAYLGGICSRLGCPPIRVGGYKDHIHILCILSAKIPLMKLMEEVKGHSSKWIKTKGHRYKNFYWQNGYAAFSVNPRGVERVTKYIENQHAHHGKNTFKEELIAFLREYQIKFEERYLWD